LNPFSALWQTQKAPKTSKAAAGPVEVKIRPCCIVSGQTLMKLYHFHPPKPEDKKWYHQTAPSECTVEELIQLRKPPKYTWFQRFCQILLFLIFGPLKIVTAVPFGIISGAFFVLLVSIWRSLGRPEPFRRVLMKLWAVVARVFLFLIGFHRIRYHGAQDSDARFLVGNHTCFFDGWFYLPFEPRLLGKKELAKVPVIGDMADVYRAIPVDRGQSTGVTKILIENAMNKNNPIIQIFPEGASTSGDYMLKFHLGAFLSDVPVQPCVSRFTLYGTSRSISHISFMHHDWRHWLVFLGIPSISLDLSLLEPMSLKTHGENDPRKFADAVSLRMANELGVRLLNLSSSAIFREDNRPKPD
jgi:1-acyl-sn-glycerol-3-phosphate acyltransferase